MIAPVPYNETARLEALYAYAVLDTPPEHQFDILAAEVAAALEAPIAIIGFIDQTRHWFKAKFGTQISVNQREWATCAHTIYQATTLAVPNVRREPRFADMPPLQEAQILAYAGAPIINSEGCAVGTVCVFDHQTRPFTEPQIQKLEQFAQKVLVLLEARVRQEESAGIEVATQLLLPSQPVAGLESQILKRIRQQAKPEAVARIERYNQNQWRLHLRADKPQGMHWQIWVMNPSDNAPQPLQIFEPLSPDFVVPAQTRMVMVSLESTAKPAVYPTQIIAVLPLESQSN